MSGSVSKKTSYVVAGEAAGSKLDAYEVVDHDIAAVGRAVRRQADAGLDPILL